MKPAMTSRQIYQLPLAMLLMFAMMTEALGNQAQNEALFRASADGDLGAVTLLLDEGANPNAVIKNASSPRTPVTAAIAGGHLEIVKALIAAGVDPDTTLITEGSPLINAARYGQPHIVAWLLDAGADPNTTVTVDGSPLINAARHGHADIVTLLLEAGADPNLQVRGDGTALTNAARNGDVIIVSDLIAHGGDVNQYSRFDDTPLINAVRGGHDEVVHLLIAAGADVNQKGDRQGLSRRTPLKMARNASPEIADILIQAGATQ